MINAMSNKKPQPNVYAFIDSQNLNLGTQRSGWKMDWRRFRNFLADRYGVTHAYMFIGYMAENTAMYEQLHEHGYLIVLKPTVGMNDEPKEEVEGEEKKPIKGNIDADLVLYAMKELPNYDKAIIVSGDGDFYGLAEYLTEQDKLLHIMTPNWRYSTLLKPFESYIVRLDQLRHELAYHDHGKRRPRPT
jgi:uncharacterized LabA/DUF88 family protein